MSHALDIIIGGRLTLRVQILACSSPLGKESCQFKMVGSSPGQDSFVHSSTDTCHFCVHGTFQSHHPSCLAILFLLQNISGSKGDRGTEE